MKMVIFPMLKLCYSSLVLQAQLAADLLWTLDLKINAHYAVCKAGLHAATQHETQEFRPGLENGLQADGQSPVTAMKY
jgi:hypothetical protein